MSDVETLERRILDTIANAADEAALENARVAALGKKGSVSELLKTLGSMGPEERREKGPLFNGLRDRVSEAQIDRKSPHVGTERRAGLQSQRRPRCELLGAARAKAAMQPHLGDVRLDFGNLNAVVDVNRLLRNARHIRLAMRAMIGHDVPLLGRVGMQRTMRPGVRFALALARGLAVALMALRRRRTRVVGGLWGQVQFFSQLCVLGSQLRVVRPQRRILSFQGGQARQHRRDQRILIGARIRQSHP